MRSLPYLLVLLFTLTSCLSDDDYTTSPNDQLTFSTDTVKFDTIISGEPTKTYTLTAYNHAPKALRINTVSLKNGSQSPFKVVADGVALTNGQASDLEIARKDSLIVYLMANVPNADADTLTPHTDQLQFQLEAGTTQHVTLTAQGQDVIPLQATHITTNQTLNATRPYRVTDSLVVDQGATLTLAPGVTLLFHAGAALIVHGTLRIEGTLTQPVTLRGDRFDHMFQNQPYDRTPGLWQGIHLTQKSYNNLFQYADIHSAICGIRIDSCSLDTTTLTLENSIIHTTSSHAIDARMAKTLVGNSQITNAGADCLHLRGGNHQFIHCTIARFYVFSGGSGHALNFANYDNNTPLPLQQLLFANCLITGYSDDEIMGAKAPDELANNPIPFNYSFTHSLLNTPEPKADSDESTHFTQCRWDQKADSSQQPNDSTLRDKNFLPAFNTAQLLFNFQLNPQSKAVGTASPTITQQYYPNDRLNQPRTPNPDMGCYQHQAANTDKKQQ